MRVKTTHDVQVTPFEIGKVLGNEYGDAIAAFFNSLSKVLVGNISPNELYYENRKIRKAVEGFSDETYTLILMFAFMLRKGGNGVTDQEHRDEVFKIEVKDALKQKKIYDKALHRKAQR